MMGAELEHLITLLGRLPGLGPRSARRVVLHLFRKRDQLLRPLAQALIEADDKLTSCTLCHNLDVIDPCHLCQDHRREATQLCVVEDVADLWAMERTHAFKGRYFVLGGVLSALAGVTPEQLHVPQLVQRVRDETIHEVIMALPATVDGQTTAHYVSDALKSLDIRISSLAQGVPLGGELDYLDEGTLIAALQARRSA